MFVFNNDYFEWRFALKLIQDVGSLICGCIIAGYQLCWQRRLGYNARELVGEKFGAVARREHYRSFHVRLDYPSGEVVIGLFFLRRLHFVSQFQSYG